MTKLEDLKKAKAFSDARQYEQKHLIMRTMIETDPDEFEVDSEAEGIMGITHTPTGFQMHLPAHVLADLNVVKKKAALKTRRAGQGLAKFKGGGRGTYSKMPSLTGLMKSDLTNATKDVGEEAEQKSPWAKMYPATYAHYSGEFLNKGKLASKSSAFSADASKYLGYSPGFWYDDSVEGKNRMRIGNLITGSGVAGAGLASIPLLQYLFPERFEDKGTALTIAALAGGLALPWLANLPHTGSELNSLSTPANENYGAAEQEKFINNFRAATYKQSESNESATTEELNEKQAFLPLGTPISKMHLADVAAEQFQTGMIDYGQAAGLMRAASQASPQPWFTVGDLARAAIGAGAGAIAGTAAAKGIGTFMNISPTEQRLMQGTGAALGTLINLGKFGL